MEADSLRRRVSTLQPSLERLDIFIHVYQSSMCIEGTEVNWVLNLSLSKVNQL